MAALQILEVGFHHADPHPGNLLRLDGARLAYIDFGMMGSIDNNIRRCAQRQPWPAEGFPGLGVQRGPHLPLPHSCLCPACTHACTMPAHHAAVSCRPGQLHAPCGVLGGVCWGFSVG